MTIAPDAVAIRALLEDFSIEMTGKDVRNLEAARSTIPPGTRVNVAFLGNEDLDMRLAAAAAVKRCGLVPVPHISARRLPSADALGAFLAALRRAEASANVFVVGGDPAKPEGPYEDALGVIRTGLLPAYAVRHVGIAGYPEGHPDIGERALWSSLEAKVGEIDAAGLTGTIITQLGFDADPVLAWVEDVRKRGIDLPIRVGVPGPAGVRRLLAFAARVGVGTSSGIAKKYGFSITNLAGTTGPGRFIRALADGYDADRHGVLRLHFYTFGGISATSEWIAAFKKEALT
ncbi:MAG TPA: methylenetetrahydrofolate reductase [Trebonia sp.]|jgi:methylenetetrahydrofolate reductase (NADPH)